MDKLIAINYNGHIEVRPASKLQYTPAGWRPGGALRREPPTREPATICTGVSNVRANDARVLDEETAAEWLAIEAEIKALYEKHRQFIADRFLTLALVQEGDVPRSQTVRYATKAEASK